MNDPHLIPLWAALAITLTALSIPPALFAASMQRMIKDGMPKTLHGEARRWQAGAVVMLSVMLLLAAALMMWRPTA